MKNKLNAKRLNIWTVLAWLFVATSLVFAGCSKQIASVKEHQLKLQDIVQINTQQIAIDAERIEAISKAVNGIGQNQTNLQQQVVALQNDNDLLREQMIAVLTQLKEQISQISSQIRSAEMAQQ